MKIVTAVNAMLANADKITNVLDGASSVNDEYFFIYKNKFKWSVAKGKTPDAYVVWFYPDTERSLEELASLDDEQFNEVNMVKYAAKEIGTKEAMDTFSELHRVVKEKVFGMDAILSEIIKDLEK